MTEMKVKLLRPMIGERRFERGEERTLAKADAERLIASGAAEAVPGRNARPVPVRKTTAKAAPARRTQAEAKAPANKAGHAGRAR